MLNARWSGIDIEGELSRMESLLSATLFMNFDDDVERSVVMDLISITLLRIRELKAVSEVSHE